MALFLWFGGFFSLSFHRKNEHAEKNINVPYNKMSVNLMGEGLILFFFYYTKGNSDPFFAS